MSIGRGGFLKPLYEGIEQAGRLHLEIQEKKRYPSGAE
jgi:hypothetical protein